MNRAALNLNPSVGQDWIDGVRLLVAGNGKTLRTERAEACFPLNWVTTGGPSSAKAGQNGKTHNSNALP